MLFMHDKQMIVVDRMPELQDINYVIDKYSCVVNVSDGVGVTMELQGKLPSFWFPVHECNWWGYAPFYGFAKVYDVYKSADKPILIHCHAGVNRSTSIAFCTLVADGYDITTAQNIIDRNYAMTTVQGNIDKGCIPIDICDFLKARYEYPTYSMQGLLQTIKSPNLIGESYKTKR